MQTKPQRPFNKLQFSALLREIWFAKDVNYPYLDLDGGRVGCVIQNTSPGLSGDLTRLWGSPTKIPMGGLEVVWEMFVPLPLAECVTLMMQRAAFFVRVLQVRGYTVSFGEGTRRGRFRGPVDLVIMRIDAPEEHQSDEALLETVNTIARTLTLLGTPGLRVVELTS